jgi:m7GpppX diphosphatase
MGFARAYEYTIVPETPAMLAHPSVVAFVETEIQRPSKQWITKIIQGNQEVDEVILRTDEFVLLPDTERVNRNCYPSTCNRPPSPPHQQAPYQCRRVLNWLSIVHDESVHSMRDLRGAHIPMLKRMLQSCTETIQEKTGIHRDQVMAYVHYPPSVYQLHVHFCFPYGQYCHRDAFRVHSLANIINNLEIDPDYYTKVTLHLPLYRHSLHHAALLEA